MVDREPYGWYRYVNIARDMVCEAWTSRRFDCGGRNWKKSQKKIRLERRRTGKRK